MKKSIFLAVVIALSLFVSINGTLAVLFSADENRNTFVSGRVYIDLWEDFGDNSGIETLVPTTGKDKNGNITNAIEKEVYVENTGSEEAFVRVHIAIPSILDDGADSFDASANILHFNYTEESIADGRWNWKTENGRDWNYYVCNIGGVDYNVYVVTYESALDPGYSTVDAISQVYLDSAVTNEDLDSLDDILGDEWYIYVGAEGAQADGFEDAYTALNATFGVPGEYHFDWLAVTAKEVTFLDTIYVSSAEEWAEALYNGKAYTGYIILTDDIVLDDGETLGIGADDNVIVNLDGHTITQNGFWIDSEGNKHGEAGLYNYGIAVITGDGHVNAAGYAVVNFGTMTIKNGTFEGEYSGVLSDVSYSSEDIKTSLTVYDGVFAAAPEGSDYESIGLQNWGGELYIYGGSYSGYEDGLVNDSGYREIDGKEFFGEAYIYGIDSAQSTYANQGTGVTNTTYNTQGSITIMDGDYYHIDFDNVVIKGGAFTNCRIVDSEALGTFALFDHCTFQHQKEGQFCSISNGTFNYCDFVGRIYNKKELFVSIYYGEFNYCNMKGCYITDPAGQNNKGIVCNACTFGSADNGVGSKLSTEVYNGTYKNCQFGECTVSGGLMDSACIFSTECNVIKYTPSIDSGNQ